MTERPIIFSALMVRAILDGRKTQTRRIIKPQPEFMRPLDGVGYLSKQFCKPAGSDKWGMWLEGWLSLGRWDLASTEHACPYGVPGDLLWVRETWCHTGAGVWTVRDAQMATDVGKIVYRADSDPVGSQWFPSIHMPKKVARIWLRITDVRVQRVQEITPADCLAEGIVAEQHADGLGNPCDEIRMIEAFQGLWQGINGPDAWDRNDWDRNDWVWALTFEQTEPPK